MKTNKIKRRVISRKKHTLGYVLNDGKTVTREEAVRMASAGRIAGVRVINGNPPYLTSTTSTNLYDLPEVHQGSKVSSRRSSR